MSMTATPITPDLLRGALDHERTSDGLVPHRLPAWARERLPDVQFSVAQAHPSGVRLMFRTAAAHIELAVLPTKRVYLGLPARPDGAYDMVVDGEFRERAVAIGGDTIAIDVSTGAEEFRPGGPSTITFEPGDMGVEKSIQIWLPYNEGVTLIGLATDAPVEPDPAPPKTWLHYGSSISQGSNASGPSATFPALAASTLGLDLVNLGFAGSALLDPFVARVVRDTAADLISLEIGINLVNTDAMSLRAFVPAVEGFLDTIRDGHPTTPVVVVSPLYCAIHENIPGPGAFDPVALAVGEVRFIATGSPGAGKLTLTVVRSALAEVVRRRSTTDPNLYYLDGLDLYGEDDFADLPLPDGLHPDAESHLRIGTRFGAAVSAILPSEPGDGIDAVLRDGFELRQSRP